MSKLSKLPLGLWPHHDGSELYVVNQHPKLLETVKLRVRVNAAIGEVKRVVVRYSESGEAFPSPAAKVVKRQGSWTWYEAEITMHNPRMNYRWRFDMASGDVYWLNAVGLHELSQPDINDFRINTFSSAPTWSPDSVMYQIFPDRFARSTKADKHKTPDWAIPAGWGDEVIGSGPGTGQQFFGGDLWGVIEHLDHLKKLGVNLIYLTPIFPGRSNHRYDASSFDHVDPLLGGDAALSALIDEAHKRGFRIVGDLTTNHSGVGHEWFKAAYGNPSAPESEFYYFGKGNKTYDSWFGVPSLPKFNWKSTELRKRFIEGNRSVVAKWLKKPFGFDGWRIDVANMTGRIRDEDMYAEVANVIRKTMVSVNPDTVMLGEYTGDAAYEVQGDGWQGAMTYSNFTRPLWRWLFDGERKVKGNGDRAKEIVLPGYMEPDGKLTSTGTEFWRSHVLFAAGFPWHVRLNNMNPLDTHDIPRFRTFALKGSQEVAAGLQFTMPGIPVIWAGDEFGLEGWNGEASRTPIPWNGERPSDPALIPVYSQLAKLRRENLALVRGSLRFVLAEKEIIAFTRETSKSRVLVVATRAKAAGAELPIEAVTGIEGATRIYGEGKLWAGKKHAKIDSPKLTLTVWRLPAKG